MLDVLISSQTKRAILTHLLTHADEQFYVRQLAGILNISVGTMHRELVKFEKSGILKAQHVGTLRFFSINKQTPLFKELKQMILKTEGVEGSLRALVHQYEGILIACLYGSVVRGAEKKTSDIDVIVVGEGSMASFVRDLRALEERLQREINLTHYTTKDFDTERKKIGSFLNVVLNDKIIMLKGDL